MAFSLIQIIYINVLHTICKRRADYFFLFTLAFIVKNKVNIVFRGILSVLFILGTSSGLFVSFYSVSYYCSLFIMRYAAQERLMLFRSTFKAVTLSLVLL